MVYLKGKIIEIAIDAWQIDCAPDGENLPLRDEQLRWILNILFPELQRIFNLSDCKIVQDPLESPSWLYLNATSSLKSLTLNKVDELVAPFKVKIDALKLQIHFEIIDDEIPLPAVEILAQASQSPWPIMRSRLSKEEARATQELNNIVVDYFYPPEID